MVRFVGFLVTLVFAVFAPVVLSIGAMSSAGLGSGGGSGSLVAQEMSALGLENGLLPDELLVTVSSHGSYACRVTSFAGAASAWLLLVEAAAIDGVDIEGGWCYRTYDEQLAVWTSRECFVPGNCDGNPYPPTAEPGTSNHGWGLAVDVWGAGDSILSCGSPEFGWMLVNAPSFGWVHPDWAWCGLASQEPWHWEFEGSGPAGLGVETGNEIGEESD